MISSCHSLIVKNDDLFTKIITQTEYDETLKTATRREASFQRWAGEVLEQVPTPVKVGVPRLRGVVDRVIVMDNVPGVTFERLIRSDIEKARRLVPSLRMAVNALIEAGIYHNDLYPDNVLWDEDSGTIWIVDFGFAKDTHLWEDPDQLSEFAF